MNVIIIMYRVRLQVRMTKTRNNRVPTTIYRKDRRISQYQKKLQVCFFWWSVWSVHAHPMLKRHHITFLPGTIRAKEAGQGRLCHNRDAVSRRRRGSSPPTSNRMRHRPDRPVESTFSRFPFPLSISQFPYFSVIVFYLF